MTNPAKHPVDQVLPAGRLALLGLQHMSIMYAGSVAVPLIVGSALKLDTATIALLVNADLLVAGIATLIQSIGVWKILGIRLPVVAGATFSVVNPMILIASQYGMRAVYGAMLASGVFGLLIARPFAKMIRFFPPLMSGTLLAVLGGVMNSFPDTAFAQHVGLVQMTGVRSRWVVSVTGGVLVLMGLVPKVGAFIAAIPEPVIGAVAVVMFAMVAAVGVQTLAKVEFSGNHTTFVVAVSLGVGLLPAVALDRFGGSIFFKNFPNWLQTVCGSPITVTAIVAFSLNLLFNHLGRASAKERMDENSRAAPL
ncbi:solute carrier family 23 protein [Amycolatopsis sp. H20-H5]|uniref:solute carrier family 23 protein n=1 Tax=Amycolatopsis sp. H20-H5 TaxID=3046309 RepID=UPI002DB7466A|nr:solute carrier family 23 protein [Amycolatopsis sp. H20-H5]MEC3975429.1 solute carrier family 23 protein [Amycolatopsis sp. H20-H5]